MTFYLLNVTDFAFCCLPTETPPLALQLQIKRDTAKTRIKNITFNFFMAILLLN